VPYRNYAHQDLVPALGRVRLNKLSYAHIAAFIRDQVAAGHGRTSVYRCLVTLLSALGEVARLNAPRLARNCGSIMPARSGGRVLSVLSKFLAGS
jgi:hypothetical protein